jgi:Flp pilus assembly protein TadG
VRSLSNIASLIKKRLPGAFSGAISRLRKSTEGVGAVEFALIVPILLIIYLMSFEITVAISVVRKVTRSASDIADLTTQKSPIDKSYLATMPYVANAILAPYSSTGLTVKISGITVDSLSVAKIAWSWQTGGTKPYTAGTSVTIPTDLAIPNSFLVHSELSLPYSLLFYLPGLSGTQTKSLTIRKEFFYRQRTGSSITCTDC